MLRRLRGVPPRLDSSCRGVGSDQYFDIGMLATGLMIATLPVLALYVFLSEWFVKGMTAGAIKG